MSSPTAHQAPGPLQVEVSAGGILVQGGTVFTAVCCAVAAGIGWSDASFAFAVLAAFGLVLSGLRITGRYNNFATLFLIFHLLYGLSGPMAALYGEPFAPIFTMPYETDAFLIQFGLATAGLAIGLIWGGQRWRLGEGASGLAARPVAGIFTLALGFAVLASGMELINLLRVGVGVLIQGKAAYQSDVDALILTLPAYEVARVAITLYALAIATRAPRRGLLFLAALLPLLAIALFLGRRGPLLEAVFILMLGRGYLVSLRRVSVRLMSFLLLTYVVMGVLFANRGLIAYAALVGDPSVVTDRMFERERIILAINPGGNEFGSAFGNFSEYVKYDTEGPQFGRTYVESFALLVPAFMFPWPKPAPVAFEFRDRFFPSEAAAGSVGSTAYSSILEAYVNFRGAGAVLIYVLLGLCLAWLESRRDRSSSLFFAMVYLSIIPVAIVFHRSDFGAGVVGPLFYSVALAALAVSMLGSAGLLRSLLSSPRPSPRTSQPG